MATYVCGKMGKSIKFNPKHWKGLGGDNEAPTLLISMAKNNPNDNFIIIGKNDLQKYGEAPSNLYSISQFTGTDVYEDGVDYIWKALKRILQVSMITIKMLNSH